MMRSMRWLIGTLSIMMVGCQLSSQPPQEDTFEAGNAEAFHTAMFSFETQGRRLVGLFDTPESVIPTSTIIIVHGYGPTNVVDQNGYSELRSQFVAMGMNVLVWDKPGRGQSEGEFDINQSVESSAEEVVAAVRALKEKALPGTEKIGLWGISRAGWIVPLAIQAEPAIDFWISVSGVDDKENARYLLSSNLPIEGRSAEETERLIHAWQQSFNTVWQGGNYQQYLEASAALNDDPFLEFMGWKQPVSKKAFEAYQEQYNSGGLIVDKERELVVYVPDFSIVLSELNIPVLALFGEKDTNVDWRKTAELYSETIGRNPAAELTVFTFPEANHNLKQAATGGVREMFSQPASTPYAEGYFDVMTSWLEANGFSSRQENSN